MALFAISASSSIDSLMQRFKWSIPSPVEAETGTTCLKVIQFFGNKSSGKRSENSAGAKQKTEWMNAENIKNYNKNAPKKKKKSTLPCGFCSCSFSSASLSSASGRSILLTTSKADLDTSSSLYSSNSLEAKVKRMREKVNASRHFHTWTVYELFISRASGLYVWTQTLPYFPAGIALKYQIWVNWNDTRQRSHT